MDLQQQQAALKNTIRLLEAASRAVDNSEPALVAAVAQVRDLIRGLPDGLFRERAWKELKPRVVSILARASGVIGDQLSLTMAALTPEQAQFASNYLVSPEGYGFSADAPGAAAARRASTGENSAYAARTVEAFPKSTFTLADIAAAGSSPELLGRLQQRVPDDVAALIKKTPIRGATLQRWFGSSATATGVGRQPEFAKWAASSIDRHVRAGFLGQVSTEEIARNLIFDEVRGQMRLGHGAVRLKSDARAIAKTGLMDLADQAHMAQLRAMEKESGRTIAKRFRWDASTDSRLCPDCALLDGQEWEKREDVPPRPHIGCRCQILGVTATELLLREEGNSIRSRESVVSVEFTDQPPPPQRPGETRAQYSARMRDEGIFLTKGRAPSGEMQWRRRVVRRAGQDAPEWLASMARATSDKKAAALSLQEFFQGNRAGAQRAAYFVSQIQKGADPRDALNNMLRQVGGNPKQTQFIPVAKLRKLNPSIEDATPILSARQKRYAKANVSAPAPRRGYGVGNPSRAVWGEENNIAIASKIDAKGSKAFASKLPGSLDQQIADGRAIQADLLGRNAAKVSTLTDDFRTSFGKKIRVDADIRNPATTAERLKAAKRASIAAKEEALAVLRKTEPAMQDLYKQMLKTDLTEAQVKKLVEGVTIKGGTAAQRELIRGDLDQFVRLFNGGGVKQAGGKFLGTVSIEDIPVGYSHFDSRKNTVVLSAQAFKQDRGMQRAVFMHEAGHALEEQVPGLAKRAEAWQRRRSPASEPQFLPMSDAPDDVIEGWPDRFINSYVGSSYGEWSDDYSTRKQVASEVVSVGIEYLVDPRMAAELLARDPDHAALIFSLTRISAP